MKQRFGAMEFDFWALKSSNWRMERTYTALEVDVGVGKQRLMALEGNNVGAKRTIMAARHYFRRRRWRKRGL
ncbi:MAG: hypothetical protein LBL74_06720 [Bacteroidales bacterium]|nr:hypothetical protein [Bacteroidales bacterium]